MAQNLFPDDDQADLEDLEDGDELDDLDEPEDEAEEPEEGFTSMRELYDALYNGDGGPVYLSDGVWLNPDGSVD